MHSDRTDVVIVGAGAAGLAAAHELTLAGRKVVVVEARKRIGGRIDTIRDPKWPLPIEAGAEFVHGEAKQTKSALRSLNLIADDLPESDWAPGPNGLETLDFAGWEILSKRLSALQGRDLSFADFLKIHGADLTAPEQAHALAYVEGFEAADALKISAAWLADAEAETGPEEGAQRIRSGYASMLDRYLQTNFARRLGWEVSTIHWRRGWVRVESKAEAIEAAAAILTVPLGVLQIPRDEPGSLRFEPEITEKRETWSKLEFGQVVKLVMCFRSAFWDDQAPGMVFLHTPDSPFGAWWTARPSDAPLLTGWSGGPRAASLSRRDPGEVLEIGVQTLASALRMSEDSVKQLLADWRVFDWQADPFSRGAYAYVPVGGGNLPNLLAQPVENTLFFAGEATHALLTGTVEGALATGVRAAEQVLLASR
jgi:monoamine oxidase